jgi:predicted transcriptional regulator
MKEWMCGMPAERIPMSGAEREVLKLFWDHGAMGVRDVVAHLCQAGQEWSRSTVITLLKRLENKGYVASDRSRFAFVYRAVVSREDEMRSRLNEVAEELCDGKPVPLLLAFTERHQFTAEELARFRQMIDAIDAKSRKRGRH